MKTTEKHISQLADRLVSHIIYGRSQKALAIAQYIRAAAGRFYIIDGFCPKTGHSTKRHTTRRVS